MEVVSIHRQWCKGCGICVAFCRPKALALDADGKACVANPEACIACGLCELYCPDLAIVFAGRPKKGAAASSAGEDLSAGDAS